MTYSHVEKGGKGTNHLAELQMELVSHHHGAIMDALSWSIAWIKERPSHDEGRVSTTFFLDYNSTMADLGLQ